jgi:APA family basic amino acid/polyamine antiporter
LGQIDSQPAEVMTRATDDDLRRVIRVRDGLAVAVGIVIGAGILRTPGLIAGYLGDARLILGVWLLGGIIAGLSTLLLAEMAAALPTAGGKYVYAKEAWGPVAGFVAGWAEVIVSRGFSGASKAVVIATYATELAGRGSIPVLAGTVVVAFTMLHLGGLEFGTRFQNITTILKIAVLLGIAAAGFMAGDATGFSERMAVNPEYAGLLGFALAYQSVAFAYYGWEDAAKMAEEVRDPGRSLPRILIGGAAAVAFLYILINVAFLFALTPAEMAGSTLVARDAVAATFGDATGKIVQVAGLIILLSSANVNFLATPRVAFALARDGLAPQLLTRVSSRGTPTYALFVVSAVIFVLAVSGTFETLIRFMMLVAISVDLIVFLGFFRLRSKRPDLHRPLRVPLHPVLPALTVLLYVIVLGIIVFTQPELAVGGGLMLLALFTAGYFTARRRA